MPTREKIFEILSRVNDPELKRPLTELKMVRDVEVANGGVRISIALTVPGCPLRDKIEEDIRTAVVALDDVSTVDIKFEVLSQTELASLKELLSHGQVASSTQRYELPVKQTIAIASGKGGVGKSTVTVNLAAALSRLGYRIGVADADLFGYSIPRMLGLDAYPDTNADNRTVPLRFQDTMQVLSPGCFTRSHEAVTWRWPQLHKAFTDFLFASEWDLLDYLFIDLPPGTGDLSVAITQTVPSASILLVTTPQVVSVDVASRIAKLASRADLRMLGVIENMAFYESHGQKEYIFGSGGGQQLADELGLRLLAQIPLLTSLREGCDVGRPVALFGSADETALFEQLARQVLKVAPI